MYIGNLLRSALLHYYFLHYYLLTMAVVWRLYGGYMVVVWWKSLGSRISANPDITTLYHHTAAQLLSYCSGIPDIVRWYEP